MHTFEAPVIRRRLTLIKSILINLPTYYMSIFEMPKGIVRKLEQLFRKFLWGDKKDSKKVHLVPWSQVIKPKSKGDGIKPYYAS